MSVHVTSSEVAGSAAVGSANGASGRCGGSATSSTWMVTSTESSMAESGSPSAFLPSVTRTVRVYVDTDS